MLKRLIYFLYKELKKLSKMLPKKSPNSNKLLNLFISNIILISCLKSFSNKKKKKRLRVFFHRKIQFLWDVCLNIPDFCYNGTLSHLLISCCMLQILLFKNIPLNFMEFELRVSHGIQIILPQRGSDLSDSLWIKSNQYFETLR